MSSPPESATAVEPRVEWDLTPTTEAREGRPSTFVWRVSQAEPSTVERVVLRARLKASASLLCASAPWVGADPWCRVALTFTPEEPAREALWGVLGLVGRDGSRRWYRVQRIEFLVSETDEQEDGSDGASPPSWVRSKLQELTAEEVEAWLPGATGD